MMIICTTFEQLSEWLKCEYFQIDLSFKWVAGEINEFEINNYDTKHNLSKLIIIIYCSCNDNTISLWLSISIYEQYEKFTWLKFKLINFF
jgi:hypothetical protein